MPSMSTSRSRGLSDPGDRKGPVRRPAREGLEGLARFLGNAFGPVAPARAPNPAIARSGGGPPPTWDRSGEVGLDRPAGIGVPKTCVRGVPSCALRILLLTISPTSRVSQTLDY